MGGQTNFTGAAIGVASLHIRLFDSGTEFAQRILVHLWIVETLVASKTTATHALWQHHIA